MPLRILRVHYYLLRQESNKKLSTIPCIGEGRIALVLVFFFSTYLQHAYHGVLLPILGFIFLPLTTLVYAWLVNSNLPVAGVNLVILIIAVMIDIGGWGGEE